MKEDQIYEQKSIIDKKHICKIGGIKITWAIKIKLTMLVKSWTLRLRLLLGSILLRSQNIRLEWAYVVGRKIRKKDQT